MQPPNLKTFDEVLRFRTEMGADQRAYGVWDKDNVSTWLSFGDVDRRARSIAAELQAHDLAGQRAILLFPPGLDYICAFFGCLYARVIAVPAYPPEPARLDRTLPRLSAIVTDAQATVVLTTSAILGFRELVASMSPALASTRWFAIDVLDRADDWRPMAGKSDEVAFLQYTSGSTGTPKGVMVTHANLLHNCSVLQGGIESTPETLQVSWLPPYHDMGLIAGILQASYVGFPLVVMSPIEFLLRPRRWLEAITKTRAHISGTPNFALDLCVQKIPRSEREGLDLSSLQFVYVSAEPVRRSSLERFSEAFAECGFDARALYPTYGLAEATLVVSGGLKLEGFRTTVIETPEAGGEIVSVGRPGTRPGIDGGQILVVDPESRGRLGEQRIGEIWLRSASIAQGYWNRPEETAATFGARTADGDGPWLRTGDLGFLLDGELYVTGRLKEVIIIRGRKHFPSDLEDTIEATNLGAPYYRAGGTAAFSAEVDGEERLCLAVEVERRQRSRRESVSWDAEERRRGRDRRSRPFHYRAVVEGPSFEADTVVEAIRRAIARTHGIEPWLIALLRPGAVPKTSSGKKRRVYCRELYLGHAPHADVLHLWRSDER